MITEDRDVYLAKCKKHALAYLPNVPDAIASIMSDLRQHDDFKGIVDKLTPLGLHIAIQRDEYEARLFIEGFR